MASLGKDDYILIVIGLHKGLISVDAVQNE
jgi:hypothetical protein